MTLKEQRAWRRWETALNLFDTAEASDDPGLRSRAKQRLKRAKARFVLTYDVAGLLVRVVLR